MGFVESLLAETRWQEWLPGLGRIILILVLALIARVIIRKGLARIQENLLQRETRRFGTESGKRVDTIMKLARQGIFIAFWGIVLLVVLGDIGVDIGPIIASAGIVGLAVGFGAQNLVRDIISGLFMLLEDQIRVGDVAVINGTGGLVEEVNFRTVVLRDLAGVVHVFPNGGITSLSNMTHGWSAYLFEIGVAYKENTDDVVSVMKEVGAGMRGDEYYGELILEDLEVFGVDGFESSSVVIKSRMKTQPIKQWEVGREFLRRLKHAFDERGIEIPYPHQSLYFGEASRPIELRLVGDETGMESTATGT